MKSVLSFSSVTKHFKQGNTQFEIIKNASFSLSSGEIVALIGSSGSGKSTILQMAGLLDSPSSGLITIGNRDCSLLTDEEATHIRKITLGYVFQFHYLMPEFSALENVMIPLLINGIDKRIAKKRALEMLSILDLTSKANQMIFEMSGGEQQRIAIARALIHKPSLVLADEPTGSLDPENAEKVFSLFQSVVQQQKTTCLFVTHNLALAKKANRVLTIQNKQLIEWHG